VGATGKILSWSLTSARGAPSAAGVGPGTGRTKNLGAGERGGGGSGVLSGSAGLQTIISHSLSQATHSLEMGWRAGYNSGAACLAGSERP